MAPAKTVMDGRSAAAFYMVANGVVFLLLLWYQAPIFRVDTVADALQLVAALFWYGTTITMYLRLQSSDPGFLRACSGLSHSGDVGRLTTSAHTSVASLACSARDSVHNGSGGNWHGHGRPHHD